MGIKASNTAEVYFEDVKVPVENLLGGQLELSLSNITLSGLLIAVSLLNQAIIKRPHFKHIDACSNFLNLNLYVMLLLFKLVNQFIT